MRHSESLVHLAPALVKARAAITAVHKDASNAYFGSRYVTLGALMDAALPALLTQGIVVMQGGGQSDDAGAEVVTRLQHESGEWIETTLRMPLTGTVKKDGTVLPINAQSAGSAQTYGQRYGLAGILGIVADDDDDGEKASGGEARAEAKPRPASRPTGTPPAPRSSGGSTFKMPFGKSKGTPLGEMTDQDLNGALDWAASKGKFEEFQSAARLELDRRQPKGVGPGMPGSFDEFPKALEDGEGDLPW